jgi:amino acid adenylation domain-containing protein/non-ribosomal peptide synthase protein (TIGR01720 family)|uniref:amino acid adenylation domain-containing protein n=1 Tax=Cephaloticoccus sp. TaxID=1985742 RepID=UPI004048FA54
MAPFAPIPPDDKLDDDELLSLLLDDDATAAPAAIPARGPHALPVLSFAQQRLWFLQHLNPASPAYNISSAVKLSGAISPAHFEAALACIVQRHEVLRTAFPSVDGRATVERHDNVRVLVGVEDIPTSELLAACTRITAQPFDLSRAPLLRLTLLRQSPTEYHAVLVMHHIISDAWSMDNFVRELGLAYAAIARGQQPDLPPLPIQYSDFAAWQQTRLDGGQRESQLAYWRTQLADLPQLDIPTDRPRPAKPNFAGTTLPFKVPTAIVKRCHALTTETDNTFFMTMLAAGHLWLSRLSGSRDIVLGAPVANRGHVALEPLIGFFVNTLALRTRIEETTTFRTLLAEARRTTLDGFAHQDVPFEAIVHTLQPDRDASRNPLFQVMLIADSATGADLTLTGLGIEPVELPSEIAKFDLTLSLRESPNGIEGALEYATALFSAITAQRFVDQFLFALELGVASPDAPLLGFPRITVADETLLANWSTGPKPAYPATSLPEVFAAQVANMPTAVALTFGSESLSYSELDTRANRLAQVLRAQGIGPDVPVGLCLERSFELVIAVLGILKAGGAYLALDPAYPVTRLRTMLASVDCPLILTNTQLGQHLPTDAAKVLVWESITDAMASAESTAPILKISPDHLAYISFTSGSTGTPKGVAVPHRAVLRLVHGNVFAHFSHDEVFLLMAPLAFDASTLELWGPLLHGGKLVIMPPGTSTLEAIGQVVRENLVTTLWLTAGLFHLMVDERLEDLKGVRQLLAGGDVLSLPHVTKVIRGLPQTTLINGYGPTENTTFTCCHQIKSADLSGGSIPIGKPIGHTTVFVLDPEGQPVPIGRPGELYTGGDGLARGYIGQPELTASVFVTLPTIPDQRLYRTGDRARWRHDGALEFLGRVDRQVKIRGHRIEPDEIEAALAGVPGVTAAAVVINDGPTGKRLVGYAAPETDPAVLRTALAARLPDYLIPAIIVTLSALPLNANGKVDRSALPAPAQAQADDDDAPPSNEVEASVAKIWCGVLGLKTIGVRANYFASGGDSIGAIQVASRLRRIGWVVSVADLFQYPTVAALAAHLIREGLGEANETTRPESWAGPVAVTPAQAWFLSQFKTGRHHFNQAVLLRPLKPLDTTHLAEAASLLWRQHDALRTVLRDDGLEILSADSPFAVEQIDLPNETARLAHCEKVQAGFDLTTGPLFRIIHQRLPDMDRLLLVAHHLVIDGVSWRMLIDDLDLAVAGLTANQPIDLGPRPLPINSWGQAVAMHANRDHDYWHHFTAQPVQPWPIKSPKAANTFGACRTVGTRLDEDTTRQLLTDAHRAFNTDVEDLLLLALGRALQHWHGGHATRVMLEGHGREGDEAIPAPENTVGWFTALHPFVLEVTTGDTARQIKTLKESRRAIPHHGNGFGPAAFLRDDPILKAAAQAVPLSFNYLGRFEDSPSGGLAFAEESSGAPIGPGVERAHEVDAGAALTGGCMAMSLTFHPERSEACEMQDLLDNWATELATLVNECRNRDHPEATPADFTSPILTLEEYESLLERYGWSARDVEDVARLSPMQAGMLFQAVFDEGSSAYFVQMAYRLRGRLDVERFIDAWHQLAQRHPILRTSLLHEGAPEPLQIIWRARAPETAVHDLRGVAPTEQQSRIAESRAADLNRRFDLARDTLWRVTVWQLTDDLCEIVWSYHHVLLDGWSLGLVQKDLLSLYAGIEISEPSAPYRDYVKWLQQRPLDAARTFWSNYLKGYENPARLPLEFTTSTPDADSNRGEHLVDLDAELSAQLRKLAASANGTLATLMQTAWGLVLGQLNRSDDVVFGAIVSGRPADLPGVERMVGLFICAVPVRIQWAVSSTFAELLGSAQREALAAEQYHHLPIAEIQTLTPLGRELFDHLLVFENYPLDRTTSIGGDAATLVIEHVEAHDRTHYNFDLTIDPGKTIWLRFGHDRSVYSDDQINRLARRFEALLRAVVRHPNEPIVQLDPLPRPEAELVTFEFNRTAQPCPHGITLLDLLNESLARNPEAPAVIDNGTTLTYRELHSRADALAVALQSCGVGPEIIVGLCVGRTAAMVVGVLGIMKAGGAYLPLDPLYPAERLQGMLDDAGVDLVVTLAAHADALPKTGPSRRLLRLDELPFTPTQPPQAVALAPAHLAYLIYTSGSTGRPKGVEIEHCSLVNAAIAWRIGYGLDTPGAAPRILQLASLSFDVFAGDFIRALTNGGALIICDADTRLDPEGLVTLLQRHRITQFESTPGLILPLMEHVRAESMALPDLRILILGSDTLRAADYRHLVADFGQDRRILNSYGITEATIDTCYYENAQPPETRGDESTPIGRPMANQRVYVLNAQNRPVGIGVPGELFIGGDGLARGYHGQPELTQHRFPTFDPGTGTEQRLYRTGDLARWRVDGTLGFLGRNDRQIKIRGVRIEPGEIEAILREHADISEALVEAREIAGGIELVAYILPLNSRSPDSGAWRRYLAERVSAVMVPPYWIVLEKLPLSPNGKVDRRALPTPVVSEETTAIPAAPPRSATERAIAAIWQEVLQVKTVNVRDDFFTLGGHSLKAMQLLSRVQRLFGVRVPIREFFDRATLAGLAATIDQRQPEATDSTSTRAGAMETIPTAPPASYYPLSFAQQRLWLLHYLGGESAYNMPEAYRIQGDINADALEQAVTRIIARHESLRTAFVEVGGDPTQRILDHVPYALRRIDLSAATNAESQTRILADEEAAAPFDLTTPPLLRATLIKLGPDSWVYLQTIHHIVGDGWSGNVLYREVFALYSAALAGKSDPLPPLRIHYKDFACWQKSRGWQRDETFWLKALRGAPAALALPYDFPPDGERNFRGDHETFTLSPAAVRTLRKLATQRRTTVANSLLAVFNLLLFQITKQTDFCIGVSIANRNHPELENLIGFFVNLLPVRVQLDETMEFGTLLDQVVAAADAAIDHQDYPFDLMVQQLNPDRAGNRQPLLNIVYAFQNFADVHVDVGLTTVGSEIPVDPSAKPLTITPFEHTFHTSKFDLTLFASNNGENLDLTLEYDTGLFKPATISRYLNLLDRFARMVGQNSSADPT